MINEDDNYKQEAIEIIENSLFCQDILQTFGEDFKDYINDDDDEKSQYIFKEVA
jgi:hypothetical protein